MSRADPGRPAPELPPADGREAAAAVLRLLHGLDPPTRLAALAMAERVIRSTTPGIADGSRLPVVPGQVWVSNTLRNTTKTILARTGDELTVRNRHRVTVCTLPEFREWVRHTGARPI